MPRADPGGAGASAPAELVKARAAFATAVAANNEKAAAALSAFPLINRVDQEKPAIPRSEFRGFFKTYREVGKCLESDRLEPEKTPQDKKTGNWLVDCGGNLVLFGQKNGHWLAYRLRKRQRVKREPRGFPGDRSAIDLVERAYPRYPIHSAPTAGA